MSASPDPTQQIQQQAAEDEVSFRFCRECSNMLYPKEDRANSQLMFACRTCNFSELAPTQCVWRNQLTNTVAETAGVTTDVGGDPTVSKGNAKSFDIAFCLMCGTLILEDLNVVKESISVQEDQVKEVERLGISWDVDKFFDEAEEGVDDEDAGR